MRAKIYRGKPFGAELSSKEKKAMLLEINRQIAESDKKYAVDVDAMVLYTLHTHLGFGKKRLRQFYDALKTGHDDLVKHYEMPDFPWLCHQKLKAIGVDVEAWHAEIQPDTTSDKFPKN